MKHIFKKYKKTSGPVTPKNLEPENHENMKIIKNHENHMFYST